MPLFRPNMLIVYNLSMDRRILKRIAADMLKSKGPGAAVLIGATDTSKTTFFFELAKLVAQKEPVALVDADTGQSRIGPPSTVGWSIINTPAFNPDDIKLAGLAFAGHIMPVGHLLPLIAGILQAYEACSKDARVILIDFPGFVAGEAAAILSAGKIRSPRA